MKFRKEPFLALALTFILFSIYSAPVYSLDYYSLQSVGTFTSDLAVSLESGTAGESEISLNKTRANVTLTNTMTIDFVDNSVSNVDSSPNKGSHSNFSAQQYGPDSIFDTLNEENTNNDWLTGWNYRKSHSITGSVIGEQTDYQMRIKVHRGNGLDVNEDLYVGTRCKLDFGDIRFTKDDGVTELDYWIEQKNYPEVSELPNWMDANSVIATASWQNISYSKTMNNPVVYASYVEGAISVSQSPQVRSVSNTGFQIRLEALPGTEENSTVFWIAVDLGTHTLGGKSFEAGKISTNSYAYGGSAGTWQTLTFGLSYSSAPVIFALPQTFSNGLWFQGAVKDVTATNASITLESAESGNVPLSPEDLGYIVIEAGIDIGVIATYLTSNEVEGHDNGNYVYSIATGEGLVCAQQTRDGSDGGWIAIESFDNTSVSIHVEEDLIGDTERSHTTEVVGIVSFNTSPESWAIFWVNVDSIPASPNTVNICAYYGNSTVSTTSNGTSTFPIFFDDFEDGDLSGWSNYQIGVLQIDQEDSNNYVVVKTSNNDPHGGQVTIGQTLSAFKLLFKTNRINSNGGAQNRYSVGNSNSDGYGPRMAAFSDSSAALAIEKRTGGSGSDLASNTFTGSPNTWYTVYFSYYNQSMQFLLKDMTDSTIQIVSTTEASYSTFTHIFIHGGWEFWSDDFAMAKYVEPEPAHGSWGTEESANYELDLEVQWTDVDFNGDSEELCIYVGEIGTENLGVEVWHNSTWNNLLTYLSSGWNNITVSSFLDSPNFTIRFKGSIESNDNTQDSYNIDATFLCVVDEENTYDYILEIISQKEYSQNTRLTLYNYSNIERLSNCTIWFQDGTTSVQIRIIEGVVTQDLGPMSVLPATDILYIVVFSEEITSGESNLSLKLETTGLNSIMYQCLIQLTLN